MFAVKDMNLINFSLFENAGLLKWRTPSKRRRIWPRAKIPSIPPTLLETRSESLPVVKTAPGIRLRQSFTYLLRGRQSGGPKTVWLLSRENCGVLGLFQAGNNKL